VTGGVINSYARHLIHPLYFSSIINGDVSGAFIDFKTTKTTADKKAERW
jgi:hypothetical protein